MSDLFINSNGIIPQSLIERLQATGRECNVLELPEHSDGAATVRQHFEQLSNEGRYYHNIYLDLTGGFNELAEFTADAVTAMQRLELRLTEVLKALKYGSQHLARADGGRIWVLCYDHSVNYSVASPSNPITNNAVIAAVQSIAKEVARFDVSVNVFLIHPPKESVDSNSWKQAKQSLKVYGMKYKPQPVQHIAELLQMYAGLKNLTTTGGIIPVGSGIAAGNI